MNIGHLCSHFHLLGEVFPNQLALLVILCTALLPLQSGSSTPVAFLHSRHGVDGDGHTRTGGCLSWKRERGYIGIGQVRNTSQRGRLIHLGGCGLRVQMGRSTTLCCGRLELQKNVSGNNIPMLWSSTSCD